MTRPPLSASLTADDFAAWYWLKEELIAFCREHTLSTTGNKPELAARIDRYLAGKTLARTPPRPRRQARMPATFTLDTVIEEGWRCGPALGAFLRQHLGNSFHFNAATRDFIHNGQGRTLADAALCYQNSVRPGSAPQAIPPQLEYLRHLRAYFLEHPAAPRRAAIAAWWAKRGRPKDPA